MRVAWVAFAMSSVRKFDTQIASPTCPKRFDKLSIPPHTVTMLPLKLTRSGAAAIFRANLNEIASCVEVFRKILRHNPNKCDTHLHAYN